MEPATVFGEWNAYAARQVLRDRDLDWRAVVRQSEFKIVAITGIRRCGKSSVLMSLLQTLRKQGRKAAYVNMEDSRLKDVPDALDEVIKWFGDEGYLLLDEITSAKDYEGWLARTHELLKGRLRLVVTSSRRSLDSPAKPLRGRMLLLELAPLSFKEFLEFNSIKLEETTASRGKLEKALQEYLKYGGFPEVALAAEEMDKIKLLNSYFKDIVALDVAEISGEAVAVVETFARYVIQAPTFSASKCLNFFKTLGYKIGKETLLSLERYAQAGNLFHFIPIFSYGIKDRSQYPRKAYAGDTGFSYAITGKLDWGRAYENAVLLELKRRNSGQYQISYWKNALQQEVDFVVRQGTAVRQAIQVSYDVENEETRKREVTALAKIAEEMAPKKTIVITKNARRAETAGKAKINYVPLVEWLLAPA